MNTPITFRSPRWFEGLLMALPAVFLVPESLPAQIVNPGFESGTSGWTESGGPGNFTTPTSYVGIYQAINPVEPTHFGLITDSGVYTESISQTFTLAAGLQSLSFSYRFLTDEYNDPAFNPFATAVLTPTIGSPVTLFTVSRDDLQAGGNGPLLPGAAYIDTQTIGQSDWQYLATDVSAFAGQSVTLSFSVDNAGDADFLLDSQLAIDDLLVSPIPEASGRAFLFLGVGVAGAMRLRRINTRRSA